ncbi:ABC transporter [Paenibacillus sp. 79R4]|uniref:ABC transporter ATP-binding protein n=1 Tax=Paenibacillus sp. 79R4 TaxID=2212847 RepID=UPI0015C1546D|nr:energy-coupling factor ABC transporter ATP-binding protein [Paenibacillus sp. 79R4]NWL89089.1 ABC transporter [Paenibacillus sp. 79R4]
MAQKNAIVEIENVSFQYNESSEQLKQICLTLYEGECVVITGPSGSGKTTLTRLVNGLIPYFHEGQLTGKIRLGQKDIGQMEPWEFGRMVGSVFQDSRSQFFTSIVRDEIAFCGENYGMDPEVLRRCVEQLAEESGLTHLLQNEVHKLSSGEKQKVAVASARLSDPPVLVMDEPSANLDMAATQQLSEIIAGLKADGKSLLIAEHRLYYLLPVADRIVYMQNGEIAAEWTPDELLALSDEQLVEYGLRSPVVNRPFSEIEWKGGPGQERMALQDVSISPGRFKQAVLGDVSFSLSEGEVIAVTGPNGAGKTTLAKTLCGLLRERSGGIRLGGSRASARQRLGRLWFVMQDSDYQLFSDSVWNELMLGHEKEAQAEERAERLLKQLDLWTYRDRHPAALSGGQKQRVTFAVGLMHQPDILILDEPTSGLDGENMRRVVKLIREIAASGVAVLIITHDYELVYSACQRLLFFSEGRLGTEHPVSKSHYSEVISLMQTLRVG